MNLQDSTGPKCDTLENGHLVLEPHSGEPSGQMDLRVFNNDGRVFTSGTMGRQL
jgi:hypothetical protein